MNIFLLDFDSKTNVSFYNDKHVVKMVLETAQILSTAVQEIEGRLIEGLYRPTHKNHPAVRWVRETHGNFSWLGRLGANLCEEYFHRYGKLHKSASVISKAVDEGFRLYKEGRLQEFEKMTAMPQMMPEQYKDENPVIAYRNYYMGEKRHLAKWTKRDKPEWFI
jgi:Pyrimidine dimer DNA glycosylase